jgi:hypothetical protein
MIPAVAWTRKENGKKLTTARCELRLEGPERHIPNRSQIPNSKLWRRLKFSNNVDAFRAVMLTERNISDPRLKNKKSSFAPLRMTIADWDLVSGILNFEQ